MILKFIEDQQNHGSELANNYSIFKELSLLGKSKTKTQPPTDNLHGTNNLVIEFVFQPN